MKPSISLLCFIIDCTSLSQHCSLQFAERNSQVILKSHEKVSYYRMAKIEK